MADIDFDDLGGSGGTDSGPPIRTILNWAGGVISLTIAAGLVNWGYQIMVRDVTGVPVVRALEGPIRVAPDDPGGQLAAHQGLAVNNVAAMGEAAPPAETLRLAPRPVDLAPEDMPQGTLLSAEDMAERDLSAGAADMLAADAGPEDEALTAAEAPVALAMLEAGLSQEGEPAADDAAPEAAFAVDETAEPLPPGALRRSPRPAPRPGEDLAARAAIAAAMASLAPVTAPGDLPAAEIIAGTALVQLGAYDQAEEALRAWERIAGQARFAGFFESKTRVVQKAGSGGRVFYRLRAAGFENLADARRFCAALTAEGADCIPVVAR